MAMPSDDAGDVFDRIADGVNTVIADSLKIREALRSLADLRERRSALRERALRPLD